MANGTIGVSQIDVLTTSGTGTLSIVPPATNTNRTLTLPDATTTIVGTDATQTLTNKTIQGGTIISGTAVASTSGTSINFTGIPSWVKRITVMFSGVSTSGTSLPQIQIGDSGGIETTGYLSIAGFVSITINTTRGTAATSGFILSTGGASTNIYSGSLIFGLLNSNNWVLTGSVYESGTSPGGILFSSGSKTLSDTLTQVRITTVNGTDTFDAGTINIMYE